MFLAPGATNPRYAPASRLKEQVQTACKNKDKEVKRSARSDKRAFIDELAGEAEQAAARRDLSAVYKITDRLCGSNTNHSAPVKDKDGNNITTKNEQAARWVNYGKASGVDSIHAEMLKADYQLGYQSSDRPFHHHYYGQQIPSIQIVLRNLLSNFPPGEGRQRRDKKGGTAPVLVYKIDKDVLFLRYDGCHFGTLELFEMQPPNQTL